MAITPSQTHVSDGAQCMQRLNDIKERRARTGRLIAGVAAASTSEMFKDQSHALTKPKAIDWSSHLSAEALSRPSCALKQAARHLKTPGLLSLGGGLPSSEYFPFSKLSFHTPTVSQLTGSTGEDDEQIITIGKDDIADGTSEYDIATAFNYSQATGSPQMMRFITEHTEIVYNPPYADWQVCQTVGSTGALEQTIRLLCDRTRGDSILTEDYTFATALETFAPQGIKTVGVPMDDDGLLPESIDKILSNWDQVARSARKPHVLYTVPTGGNPTGATMSLERRRAVYKVCQKHDIFIIEDEPYYFIQMPPYADRGPTKGQPEPVDSFVENLIPSFLSLDLNGRVLRMDSFSKVLVPGSRLGWITASAQIVEAYIRHAEVANQGPSGISQLLLWKLLDEGWGHEGYLQWLSKLRDNYTQRRNTLLDACDSFLPKEVVSWSPPAAGMFLWLSVDYSKHPDRATRSVADVEQDIFNNAIANGVLCAPGSWFRAEPDSPAPGIYLRTTYASASEAQMSVAVQRLGTAIRKSFLLQTTPRNVPA